MWASRDSKSRLPCDQVLSAPSQPDDLTKVTDLARSALHLQYSPHHELRLSEGVMRETNPRHVFEEIAMNQRSTTSRAQTTSSRKKRGGGATPKILPRHVHNTTRRALTTTNPPTCPNHRRCNRPAPVDENTRAGEGGPTSAGEGGPTSAGLRA